MAVRPNPQRRSRRATFVRFVAGVVLSIAIVLVFHKTLLQTIGNLLICDEPTAGQDHVLILGGDRRFDFVAQMYDESAVLRVLLFEDGGRNLVQFGIVAPGHEVAKEELAERSLPTESILVIPQQDGKSDWEDFQRWMRERKVVRVQVVTNRFDSQRIRHLIDLTLSGDEAEQVRVVALPDRRYDETNWWTTRMGIKEFLSSSLDLMHLYCVGPDDPTSHVRWDPAKYEQHLRQRLAPVP
jgi:hypothetical protein